MENVDMAHPDTGTVNPAMMTVKSAESHGKRSMVARTMQTILKATHMVLIRVGEVQVPGDLKKDYHTV